MIAILDASVPTNGWDFLPEGVSVSAVLVVVWGFMKYLRERDLAVRADADKNADRYKEQQSRYFESLQQSNAISEARLDAVLSEHRHMGERLVGKLEEIHREVREGNGKESP